MTSPKKRFPRLLYLLTALLCLVLAGISLWSSNLQVPTDSLPTPDELKLSPVSYGEYLVIPHNIAPLNFRIENEAYDYITCLSSTKGKPVIIKGNDVSIAKRLWKKLLESNKGETLLVTVYVKRDGVWFHFPTIRYQIAREPIDTWVIFRTSQPAFAASGEMVLVQRNLDSFKEKKLIVSKQSDDPPAFHPTLPVYACTVDKQGTFISFMDKETSTPFRQGASISLQSTDDTYNNHSSSGIPNSYWLEAFPSWSKDGKHVFSSIALESNNPVTTNAPKTLHFNLVRRSFVSSSITLGPADTLVHAAQLGKSAVSPRISPDGKYLLFCMTDNGNKPLWHKSSDLFVLNLQDGSWKPLDVVNSSDVDNQPCWSSNGRWILFGSNRLDGTYTRLYIAYFDNEGMIHKPFILPQRHPTRDDQAFVSFNTPEFLSKPNTTSQLRLMAFLLDVPDNY